MVPRFCICSSGVQPARGQHDHLKYHLSRPVLSSHQEGASIARVDFFSQIPVLDPVHRLGNVAVNPAFRARLNPKETRSQRAQAGGLLFAPWKRCNLVQDGKDDDESRTSLLCRRISVDITDVSEWYSCLETRGALRSRYCMQSPHGPAAG